MINRIILKEILRLDVGLYTKISTYFSTHAILKLIHTDLTNSNEGICWISVNEPLAVGYTVHPVVSEMSSKEKL